MRVPWLARYRLPIVAAITETPTGPLSGSVLGLERLLAESSNFRARPGIDAGMDTAKAREKIFVFDYFPGNPQDIKLARPFAAIWPADAMDLQEIASGGRYYLEPGGELVLLLTDVDRFPGPIHRRRSGLDFTAWIDAVMLDISRAADGIEHLAIREIRLLQSIAHSAWKDAPTEGEFWHAAFLVRWR